MFILDSVCVEKNYIDIQGKPQICAQCVPREGGIQNPLYTQFRQCGGETSVCEGVGMSEESPQNMGTL